MNLVMIGRFKTEQDARKVEEAIAILEEKLPNYIEVGERVERFGDDLIKLMEDVGCSILNRQELENFLYGSSLKRNGNELRLWTDETEVSAFFKLMIHNGARVEIFSAHDHKEDASSDKNDRPA